MDLSDFLDDFRHMEDIQGNRKLAEEENKMLLHSASSIDFNKLTVPVKLL